MPDRNGSLLIGVDGGGTRCRAAIAFGPDRILSEAEAGPANATTNIELAIANTRKAIELAAHSADIDADTLRRGTAYVGLAGVISDPISIQISRALGFSSCTVTDDRPSAVVGALGTEDGYLLGIGTGTIAASAKSGKFRYVGGWGLQLSDQASGGWLGRGLLERTLECYDGTFPHSPLTRRVMAKFKNSAIDIVNFSASATPSDFAEFAPDVVEAATKKDVNAATLMQDGAEYLQRALDTLGFEHSDKLCLTGGLGPSYRPYLLPHYKAATVPPLGTSLSGAVKLADLEARKAADPHK